MNWILMIATVFSIGAAGPDKPRQSTVSWKAYKVDSLEDCKTRLVQLRTKDTLHAQCQAQHIGKTYQLIQDGVDVGD